MMIYFNLRENKLVEQPHASCAHVRIVHNVGVSEFADVLCERGSTITKTDTIALIQMIGETIQSLLAQSYSVSLPFATFSSGIKGIFDSPTDQYDPERHQVRPRVMAGAKLKHFFTYGVEVEKHLLDQTRPILFQYEDVESGTANTILTPNGIGRIYGKNMTMDTEQPDQGIFFVDQDGQKIRVQKIAESRPSFCAFVVPQECVPGTYTIKFVNLHGEELREGVFNKPLTAQ